MIDADDDDVGEDGFLDAESDVILTTGKKGRIDLFLSKVRQPRSGEYDYLIVELKRPR